MLHELIHQLYSTPHTHTLHPHPTHPHTHSTLTPTPHIRPDQKPSPPLKAKSTPNLLERLGSLRKPKKSLVEDESSFVVQYLGCQGVTKTEGLDAVRVPLQQMAQPKTPTLSSTPFLVDFDVTPGGIFITDPQKKVFNRKSFPIKTITYIVRIR